MHITRRWLNKPSSKPHTVHKHNSICAQAHHCYNQRTVGMQMATGARVSIGPTGSGSNNCSPGLPAPARACWWPPRAPCAAPAPGTPSKTSPRSRHLYPSPCSRPRAAPPLRPPALVSCEKVDPAVDTVVVMREERLSYPFAGQLGCPAESSETRPGGSLREPKRDKTMVDESALDTRWKRRNQNTLGEMMNPGNQFSYKPTCIQACFIQFMDTPQQRST